MSWFFHIRHFDLAFVYSRNQPQNYTVLWHAPCAWRPTRAAPQPPVLPGMGSRPPHDPNQGKCVQYGGMGFTVNEIIGVLFKN